MLGETTVHTHTYNEYHAELKRDGDELSYEINIERTQHVDTFYIRVFAPDGCMAYDGYWSGDVDATMDDAIAEALVGSGLEEEDA